MEKKIGGIMGKNYEKVERMLVWKISIGGTAPVYFESVYDVMLYIQSHSVRTGFQVQSEQVYSMKEVSNEE